MLNTVASQVNMGYYKVEGFKMVNTGLVFISIPQIAELFQVDVEEIKSLDFIYYGETFTVYSELEGKKVEAVSESQFAHIIRELADKGNTKAKNLVDVLFRLALTELIVDTDKFMFIPCNPEQRQETLRHHTFEDDPDWKPEDPNFDPVNYAKTKLF